MEKNTAALTGAFVHVYLKVFSFLQNFFPEDGGHLPGEREVLGTLRVLPQRSSGRFPCPAAPTTPRGLVLVFLIEYYR